VSSGSYLLSGHDGPYATERFVCGEEPAGWRYVGHRKDPESGVELGRIDLLLDAVGRTLRLEVTAGGWLLRGGVVGAEALWRRGDEERSEQAHGFTGTSPAYAVAATRLAAAAGGSARLRLVAVHDSALATSTVDQSWRRDGPGQWAVDDLATGERRQLQVRDDLVLAGPGLALTEA
jgi:hypothetical protein